MTLDASKAVDWGEQARAEEKMGRGLMRLEGGSTALRVLLRLQDGEKKASSLVWFGWCRQLGGVRAWGAGGEGKTERACGQGRAEQGRRCGALDLLVNARWMNAVGLSWVFWAVCLGMGRLLDDFSLLGASGSAGSVWGLVLGRN